MIRPAFHAHRNVVPSDRSTAGAGRIAAAIAAVALSLAAGGAVAQGAPKKVDVSKGQQIAAQICVACHGADGNATGPANPKLSGQHPEYLYKQLVEFVPKQGAAQPERPNQIMQAFAAQLSDDDKRAVSAFYGTQPLKPSAAKSKERVELGKSIYRAGIASKQVPACAGCHGPVGAGIPAQYPRLAGQWAEYTESQLVQFRSGERKNSAQMTAIAARLSDAEIKAVADYVAGLR